MVETDEEQLEVLKNWWDENGTSLVLTVIVSVGAILGYRAWEANVQANGEAASAIYEDLVTATDNAIADPSNEAMKTTALSLGETIRSEHGGSSYAVFSALRLAKLAVRENDLDAAEQELRWALDNVSEPHLETITRVRLARVYLAMEDPTSAMTLLVKHEPAAGQITSFEEAKGDVYQYLGDIENARESYQRALDNMGELVEKPVLELKLADLPPTALKLATTPDEN